ncbi:hypothetical protein [[Phormidium] sp. ETS-05]|uniref:hypothetical protein n=1 Tax=[Phormidium] sp. ETS-05 TaxID=222819 RepID=UPI0018EF168D|nr:hypothetical protein [[Phormidium] sp. ETS-05]
MATTLPETKVLISHKPELTDFSDRLTSLLNRVQPPPEILCFIAAGIIGGGVGIVMAIFHYLIQIIEYLTLDSWMGKISGWGTWVISHHSPDRGDSGGIDSVAVQRLFRR